MLNGDELGRLLLQAATGGKVGDSYPGAPRTPEELWNRIGNTIVDYIKNNAEIIEGNLTGVGTPGNPTYTFNLTYPGPIAVRTVPTIATVVDTPDTANRPSGVAMGITGDFYNVTVKQNRPGHVV